MATTATSLSARVRSDRIFFAGIGVAMAVFVFVGFAPTYYLLPWLRGVTPSGFADGATLTPLVHAHATLFFAWMLLFVAQTGLIAAGRRDLHRWLGASSVGMACAIVVVGVATAVAAGQLRHGPPGRDPFTFLIIPLSSVAVFAIFTLLGVLWRRDAGTHKRLMLLGTSAMLVPAGARISANMQPWILPPGPIGGMMLANLFIVALVAYDLGVRRRLHPATLWGGGALLLSEPLRLWLGQTAAWHVVARSLIG